MISNCPLCNQKYYTGLINKSDLVNELCCFLKERIVLGGNTHEKIKAMVFMFAELYGYECYLEYYLKLEDKKAKSGYRSTRIDAVYLENKMPVLAIEIDKNAKKRNLKKMMQLECDRLWIDFSQKNKIKKKNPIPEKLEGVTTFKIFG